MAKRIKSDESGFTLIELIVSGFLTVIVLSIVAGLFVSMNTTATSVRTVTAATSTGQSVVNSVERSTRNSSSIALPLVTPTPPAGDQFLSMRTISSGSTPIWRCSAWYFSTEDSTIRFKTSGGAIPPPTVAAQRSWPLLADGISAVKGTSVFSVGTNTSGSGQSVTLTFQQSTVKGAPLRFETSSRSQTFSDSFGGALAC